MLAALAAVGTAAAAVPVVDLRVEVGMAAVGMVAVAATVGVAATAGSWAMVAAAAMAAAAAVAHSWHR